MKKLLSAIMSVSLAASLMVSIPALAEKDITVELDGKVIEFDVNPEVIDGRTLVPLRKIFEEIGALVKWDDETWTVSARKNSKTITLAIDSTDLQIDKGKTDDEGNPITETVTLEVPAQIVSGRTLVPVRAISESFGLNVDWDNENQKVVISDDDKEDDTWKENVGSIDLSKLTYEGNGVEIEGNQIKITSGGDFALTGTLKDGNITISTKEKVKLRLKGVNITSANNPCIFVENADKAYITISGDTENILVAENSEDGAIYSKENLEIKGEGSLVIESKAGHGIKASDNLSIENGKITINATDDGIHINDTFKMIGGEVNITVVGDGIDSESIVNISGGTINIETNGTPIENAKTETESANQMPFMGKWEEMADVEFEKSTKGINAEWMMVISDGEININSASHTIHCSDEIEIDGGKLNLSSKYDKGISAHGNLTINGENTIIDITKSTEGIESKNVMTINNGTIRVVSTDDALNATGGNSGMVPGGNFDGKNNGGAFTPPEGFELGKRPAKEQNATNKELQTGENQRPKMWGKGENGEIQIPQDESGMPMFQIPENGEFTPPAWNNGENGGGRMPGGFMSGRVGMKNCIIINGGYIEACGNDDCIDANGNIVINGGTVKANNPTGAFYGNFGVLDADGKFNISEEADIILTSGGGIERSQQLPQNSITLYFESVHQAGETIKVTDDKGKKVYEYSPAGSYKAVLIASKNIKTGEKYVVSAGNETFEVEITSSNTVVGTPGAGGMGMGRRQGRQTDEKTTIK